MNKLTTYQKLYFKARYSWIGVRIKLFWYRLWVRKNEFHKSLEMDSFDMMTMNKNEQSKYLSDLCRRREIAHQRDLK